ncbi:MAG: tetratricopeptide repeat protein [Pseudobdellovibrionaceae bacterium]|jgi:hypothetical protein
MKLLFFLLFISLGILSLTWVTAPAPEERPKYFVAPPPYLEYFHFGFHETMADSLWIRAIQDFDYCERKKSENLCAGSGWLYQMLETITNLSPHWRKPYATGGVALSVIISDIDGATQFFDKSVKAFPQDWNILYRAAYHSLYEEKNKEKAAQRLIAAARAGGGDWFYSLAQKLMLESGDRELAQRLYQELVNQGFSPQLLERMKSRF